VAAEQCFIRRTNEGREDAMRSDDGSDSDGHAVGEEEYVDDVEDERCADLMDPEGRTHQGATATLTHARETHGVDIRRYVTADAASPMRFYEGMKVLNYIRFEVGELRKGGMSDCDEIAAKVKAGCEARAFDDERFMTPTLQDDALLFGWEAYVDGMDDDSAVNLDGDDEGDAEEPNVIEMMQKLKLENEELRLRLFETMAAAGLVDDSEVTKTFSPAIVQGTGDVAGEHIEEKNPSKGKSDERVAVSRRSAPQTTEEKLIQEVDDGYFDSYSYFDIHRDMIGDSARTEAYRDALELNPSLIKGKKVLDVGCGTGILSMFAARGGADKVVGVDGSKRIAEVARKNAQHNGFRFRRYGSDTNCSRKVGGYRRNNPKRSIRRFSVRMDGLRIAIRVDARYCARGERSISQAWWRRSCLTSQRFTSQVSIAPRPAFHFGTMYTTFRCPRLLDSCTKAH
jgi:protein arginine N-methyltransferase 3